MPRASISYAFTQVYFPSRIKTNQFEFAVFRFDVYCSNSSPAHAVTKLSELRNPTSEQRVVRPNIVLCNSHRHQPQSGTEYGSYYS